MCSCQFFPVHEIDFFIMDYKIDHDEVALMCKLVFMQKIQVSLVLILYVFPALFLFAMIIVTIYLSFCL